MARQDQAVVATMSKRALEEQKPAKQILSVIGLSSLTKQTHTFNLHYRTSPVAVQGSCLSRCSQKDGRMVAGDAVQDGGCFDAGQDFRFLIAKESWPKSSRIS